MLRKKRIISIDISYGTYDQFVSAIINYAKARISSYVCVANVHMLIEAQESIEFQKIVNEADLVTPDGMPLAKSFQILYNQTQERVDGMSLLPRLLSEAEKENLSVYFFGGAQATLDATATFLTQTYPNLKVAGMLSPPFRPLSEIEKEEIANKIEASGANLVFVVLGCPKQERWMADMKGKIPAIMIGIGGALPVLVGQQKRAPVWMQKASLEWLYRLAQEPQRLFKRYFTTNTKFIYLITKEIFQNKNGTKR
ncbi:WecB/TagA/CpsF family glycosyltransferase [Pedobacter frigiditerrae]|uniref:WecB/TagA/CpsF family glycosyltransferase n=1 Tax=Pedobacter frigiditerrae TaxID=2530452 RepID=UPI00292FF4C8|nr:WecB/TagA/CpsF family glycosyltransferase [Pedobacter frigiditerrae]